MIYLDYNATTPIAPIMAGAGQEHGLRPGTENVPHIVALGAEARLPNTLNVSFPGIGGHALLQEALAQAWTRLTN